MSFYACVQSVCPYLKSKEAAGNCWENVYVKQGPTATFM